MNPDFEKMAERIVGVDVEDRHQSDNLAIVLCSYFSRHIERPDGDEDDMDEGGWSPWTIEKYHGAKRLISAYVADALRAAYEAGLERAAEICEGDGWEHSHTAKELAAAIRAEMSRDTCHTCRGDGDIDDGSLAGKQCPDCGKKDRHG